MFKIKIMKNILLIFTSLIVLNSCSPQLKQCKNIERYYSKNNIDLNKKDTWSVKHKYCIINSEQDSSLNKNEGILYGTVTDRRTKKRLGASITFNNNSIGVMADSLGHFEIKLPVGIYTAEVRYLGNDPLFIDKIKIKSTIKTKLIILLGTTIE